MSIEDKAQEYEAKVWEFNNRPREARTFHAGEPGYGPAECDECGGDMHPVRRSYGFTLCTSCASARESTRGR